MFLPDTARYNATEASYWSTQEAVLSPSCIVQPESSSDVSKFISVVTSITNCDFAIKSQGHAPAAGFANINDGVTLDITTLNATTISDDHSIASVGTGSAWTEVYRTLNPYNKTVAGGRNGAVGVGGLTIGGGISYYSPQVGFTCDTAVNFEVVLASSEIINANATSHLDLYRALKGGGNNFGVVTRIDFSTLETVPLFAGHLFNPANHTEDVLRAFANIAAAHDYDVHASIVTSLSFNSTTKTWSIINVPQYTLPNPNPPVYKELSSIPNITSLTSFEIQNISTLSAEPPYPQKHELFHTSTYAAPSNTSASTLLTEIFHYLNTSLSNAHPSYSPPDISWTLSLEPLPTAFTSHSHKDSILGLNTSENALITLFTGSWTNATLSNAANDLGRKLLRGMDQLAEARGLLRGFRYYNYADVSQDVLASYGGENVGFLREVSRKYDPAGVFQRKVPGGFKIPQARAMTGK